MLRRILRSLPPRPSHAFQISRARTIVTTPLQVRPSLFIYLGVSVATIATIITIHGDATQQEQEPSFDQPKKLDSPYDQLFPHRIPPSPTTDETFDLASSAGIPEEEAAGISRIDSIVLASNQPCEDVIHHISVRFSSTLNYSLFGVYDGHNGSVMSKFLGDALAYAVLGELAQLYSAYAAASNPDHVDIEDRFSFVLKDTSDGDQQFDIRGEEPGVIKGLHKGIPDPNPSEEEIDQYIKKAFLTLDSFAVNDITQAVLDLPTSKEEGVRLLSLPNAGSCALLGIYNNVKRTFKVAVTGDSRAVLGRRVALKDDAYAYETHVLSADQNGHNPLEVERLEAAHPGEKIFEKGRTLGWGLSRAFGDAVCKWSLEIQKRLHEEYLGDRIRSNCLTPPYFTAEPEITTTTIRKGDFVVLASDGLWDCLTSEEVVGLVGGWLETRGKEVKIQKGEDGEGAMVMVPFGKVARSGQDPKTGFGKGQGNGWSEGSNDGNVNKVGKEAGPTVWERTDLPVTTLKPDETIMYNWWKATKRFINVDPNAAVHLARSAIGGADKDLTGALLRLKPPRSRRYRDDISVQVIFFH